MIFKHMFSPCTLPASLLGCSVVQGWWRAVRSVLFCWIVLFFRVAQEPSIGLKTYFSAAIWWGASISTALDELGELQFQLPARCTTAWGIVADSHSPPPCSRWDHFKKKLFPNLPRCTVESASWSLICISLESHQKVYFLLF